MVREKKRPLKVFLCHASGDKPAVRDLYRRLTIEGVDAWLDQEKLLPGQDWRMEIPRAVREADVVVICVSKKSVTKEGYVQKEIKFALDIAEEKPEGTIFLIPARLEDCVIPEGLSRWQWVDLYDDNGFAKLLRSLKIRANVVGVTIEPASYVDINKELERRLDQLYTEGLAAFYTEDWDKACQRFQSILRERPNHKNASEKLAEAERQRDLAKLYKQATDALQNENWGIAVQFLEELSSKATDYKDVIQLLSKVRKQKQLRDLYTEAKALHAGKQWRAVVKVFEQISFIEPDYPDTDGLLSSAQKEVAELKRMTELNDQYSHALREMDAGSWYEARKLLESVHKSQTGFLETEKLLKKVENEIVKEEQKRKQNDQISTLYEQAHGLLRSKKWRNALDKMEEIRKLDEHFPDTDGIAEKAQKELAVEEKEAERQNKLAALYAKAVKLLKDEKYQEALDKWGEIKAIDSKYPDRQRVRRTAKRKLGMSARQSSVFQPYFYMQNMGIGWFILLAALGFGLARLVELNLNRIFRFDFPGEVTWGVAGVLQGLTAALVLGRIEKEWKGKSLLVFGVCWAVGYSMVLWALRERAALLIISIAFSLSPAVSVVLSSLWTRQIRQWQIYMLIFFGWILVWVIGLNISDYINPILNGSSLRWVLRDILAGGIGLWITVDLLQEKSANDDVSATHQRGSAKILLLAFLSVLLIRAIWGVFQDWLNIWETDLPLVEFTFLSVLSGLYGSVISFVLSKVISSWKMKHSLVVIIGWALGFGIIWFTLQAGLEFIVSIMVLGSVSIVIALKWARWSISPLKIVLIFLCWALSWKYGSALGGVLVNQLGSDYLHSFSDALIVLLGLLVTLGIYEYSSNRLIKITLLSVLGFALGNWSTSFVWGLLTFEHQVRTPLVLPIWGFIAGVAFEIPSRNQKKIFIRGGLLAVGLLIGYFSGKILFSGFMTLPNLLWGVGVGIALTISTRRISIITLITILGAAIFMLTTNAISGIDTGRLWGNLVRGAWIGLVLGFGYAYATRDLEDNTMG